MNTTPFYRNQPEGETDDSFFKKWMVNHSTPGRDIHEFSCFDPGQEEPASEEDRSSAYEQKS
jgi:hypothetical protein